MSEEDTEAYRVIMFLEEQDPKYAGKGDAFLAYVKAHYAYQDQWERENPGKTFDPDDEEHEKWYAEHPQPITTEQLERGQIDMRVEQRWKEKVKPDLDRIRADKALRGAFPAIAQNIGKQTVDLVKVTDPELAKLLVNPDGSINLTEESIAAAHKQDPIAAAVLDETIKHIEPILMALEQSVVMDEEGNYPFKINPSSSNLVHRTIDAFRRQAEENMRNAPPEIRRSPNGKQWISMEEMAAKQRAIENRRLTPQQKKAAQSELGSLYWTLTIDDINRLVIDDYGKRAKQLIQQTDNLAKKKYKPDAAPARSAQPAPKPEPAPAPTPPTVPPGKPRPPSTSTSSDVVSSRNPASGAIKTDAQRATDEMFK
jgi:hypothetical protein